MTQSHQPESPEPLKVVAELHQLIAGMRDKAGQWMVSGWDGHRVANLLEQAEAAIQAARNGAEAMRADAERYRWLSRKVSAHGVIDGWAFGFPTHLTLPAPSSAIRDPQAALGEAIDAAMKGDAHGIGT